MKYLKQIFKSYIPPQKELFSVTQSSKECGSCTDLYKTTDVTSTVEFLHKYFPIINSAASLKAFLVMGKGIKWVGNDEERNNRLLNEMLSNNNNQGVITDAIEKCFIYGHGLIRPVDYLGKLYLQPIKPFNFYIVNIKTGIIGFDLPNLYVVSKTPVKESTHYSKDYKKVDIDSGFTILNPTDNLYPLLKSEVIHVKLNENNVYGESPFLYDRLRIELCTDVLRYNIKDVGNGGVSKLLVALRENIDPRSLGINEMEARDPEAYNEAMKAMVKANKDTINKINNIEPRENAVTVYSRDHIESITNSPVNVRSIEYMQYIQSMAIEVVCNALGLHPALFMSRDGGSNAVSMAPILEYTVNVLNKPAVELFETQLLTRIQDFLGLKGGKLIFEPLDLSNPLDVASVKEKLTSVAEKALGMGVNSNEVYDFLNKNVLENTNTEKERYFNSTLKSESLMNEEIIVQ